MKNSFKIYFSFLFLPIVTFSQNITFEKWYNYNYAETGYAVQQTFDGGYIVAGRQGITVSSSNIELLKTDSLGVIQWAKFIAIGQYLNDGYDVKQTKDSGYIVTGQIELPVPGTNIFLMKTDKNGDTLWSKKFGGSGYNCFANSVLQTLDGGYTIAGGEDDSLAVLIKTNSIGDTLWTKKYLPQGTISSGFRSIQQMNDSGFVLCGGVGLSSSSSAIYLIRTNKNGDTLWTKQYQKSSFESGYSAQKTLDGGYVLAGTIWDVILNQYNFYIIKTNSVGDTLWTRTVTNADAALRAIETPDGGYIVLGSTSRVGHGSNDFYLTKTNSNGDTLWTKTYGGTDLDYGYDLKITTDGGFVMCGLTESFCSGCTYLIKTNSAGNVLAGIGEYAQNNFSMNIYPNPADDKTTIAFVQNYYNGEIWLSDITGRMIRKIKITSNTEEIFTKELNNGIYLVQITLENNIVATKKLIIQH